MNLQQKGNPAPGTSSGKFAMNGQRNPKVKKLQACEYKVKVPRITLIGGVETVDASVDS
jgi:hypothetical protein